MKTTKEDTALLASEADAAEMLGSGSNRIAEHAERNRRILSDLSRLAEIEGARAKGGLTEEDRNWCSGCVSIAAVSKKTADKFPETYGETAGHIWTLNAGEYAATALRLNDALRAANGELSRVRGMLQYAGTTAHIRSCHCEECSKIRAYLAEVEARDGK